MTDKQLGSLSEQEFDLYLEEIIEAPPPADTDQTPARSKSLTAYPS